MQKHQFGLVSVHNNYIFLLDWTQLYNLHDLHFAE